MEGANFEPTSDFYFWAASNASMDTFPGNKPQKFRNKFAQSIALGTGWEMALCEVYYPNNYHFNAEKLKEAAKFSLLYGESPSFYKSKSFTVAPATYTSDESIAGAINSVLAAGLKTSEKAPAQVKRSTTNSGRWELVSDEKHCEIFLDNDAAQFLFWQLGFGQIKYHANGFTMPIPKAANHKPIFSTASKSATILFFDSRKSYVHPAVISGAFSSLKAITTHETRTHGEIMAIDLKAAAGDYLSFKTGHLNHSVRFLNEKSAGLFKDFGFFGYDTDPGVFTFNDLPILAADPVLSIAQQPALFIYCDKIEYQLVGDTRAPLLLTVPVETPWDKPVVWLGFQRLTYVALRSGYINDIEFVIAHDTGNPVQFKGGKVILKLHFRRVK